MGLVFISINKSRCKCVAIHVSNFYIVYCPLFSLGAFFLGVRWGHCFGGIGGVWTILVPFLVGWVSGT